MKLQLSHIEKIFNPGEFSEVAAVKDVSLTFKSGENVIIEGPNGSGKSTLLYLIDGRVPLSKGRIFLDDTEISQQPPHLRSKEIFRLFQDSTHGVIAMGSISENLALAGTRGKKRSLLRPLVRNDECTTLSRCIGQYRPELKNRLGRKAFTMSPGERQGLVLSMLAMQGGSRQGVLLADEPTASLDPVMAAKCIETILSYAERGWICISVTHDREWLERHTGRLISMSAGHVIKDSAERP